MSEEIGFNQILKILHKQKQMIITITCLSFVATLAYCILTPSRYKVAGLLEIPSVGDINGPSGLSELTMISSMMGSPQAPATISTEVRSYIEFKFKDAVYEDDYTGPLLSEMKDTLSSNLVSLAAEANSLEEADAFLNSILKDLKEKYGPKIASTKQHAENQVNLLAGQTDTIKVAVKEVQGAMTELGFTAALVKDLSELSRSLVAVQSSTEQLKSILEGLNLEKFAYASKRPVDLKPTWPKTYIMLAISLVFGLSVGVYCAFLIEFFSTKKIPENEAESWPQVG